MKQTNSIGRRLGMLALAGTLVTAGASLGGSQVDAKVVRDHRPNANVSHVPAKVGAPVAKAKRTPIIRDYRPAQPTRVRAKVGAPVAEAKRTPIVRDYRPAQPTRVRAKRGH